MVLPYISWPLGFDVNPSKLTRYLLDPNGKAPGKAKFFLAHGFDAVRWQILGDQLFGHTTIANFVGIRVVPWGVNCVFQGEISTPRGTTPCIVSVWHLPASALDGIATLTTAYPC